MIDQSENRRRLSILIAWTRRLLPVLIITFVLFSFRQTPSTALLFLGVLGATALAIHLAFKLIFWGMRRFLERRIAQRKSGESN